MLRCPEPREPRSIAQLPRITNRTLALWPASVPMTLLGYEAGEDVHSGLALEGGAPTSSPCREAYVRFCHSKELGKKWCKAAGRASWDLSALAP